MPLAFANEQTTPQPWQFVAVLSAVSQPFEAVPSQLPKPALHVMPQVPAEQIDAPFGPLGHWVAQSPHALGSVWRLRQLFEQFVRPVMHVAVHAPLEHT